MKRPIQNGDGAFFISMDAGGILVVKSFKEEDKNKPKL